MSKAILEAARELITQKKYNEARQILKTIPTSSVAQQWLAKLDEIAPLRANTVTSAASPPSARRGTPAPKRSRLPLIAGVAGFVGIVVIGVVALLLAPKPAAEEQAPLPTLMPTQSSQVIPTNRTDFINYVRSGFSTLGDQPLEIDEVSVIDDEENKIIAIWLHERSAPTFSQQSRRAIQEYTEALYSAAQIYFGEADFSAYIVYATYVSHASVELEDMDGVQIGDFTPARGWRANVTLSRATKFDGIKDVEILLPDIASVLLATLPTPTVDPTSSETAFEDYVRKNFGTIGARSLGIRSVIITDVVEEHSVTILLDTQRDSELFLSQTRDILASYTDRLYENAVEYFGSRDSEHFGVQIVETISVNALTPEIESLEWVTVPDKQSTGTTFLILRLASQTRLNGTPQFDRISLADYDVIRNPSSAVVQPTSTAVPPRPTATPTQIPQTAGSGNSTSVAGMTQTEFEQYLKISYATIAGQPLDIDFVLVSEDSVGSRISIVLTDDSGLYIFSDQTEAAATDYAHRLLADARSYFGAGDVSVHVSYSYYTDDLQDFYYDDEWWYIGDYDVDNGWYVSMTLVRGYFLSGREDYKIWNYK